MNTIATTIRFTGAVLLASAFALPAQAITVSGTQLTTVETRPDLGGNVLHSGMQQVYQNNAFGTFVAVNTGTAPWPLFGPSAIAAGGGATGSAGYVSFTPTGTQTSTGSGSVANPFVMTSIATAGASGISITQVDKLVASEELYTTEITATNTSAAPLEIILYRAMDCYLGANDSGFGMIGGNTVGCIRRDTAALPSNGSDPTQPISRVEQFVDLSGGAKKELNGYSSIWNAIGTRREFSDACAPTCDQYQDNGMGLSWRVTLPAGASQTFTHATVFSPTGRLPLTATAAVAPSTAPQASNVTYTITLANPNATAVTAQTLTLELPAGFSFVPNTSSGPFPQPTASGTTVTWTGAAPVPANGTTSISLNALVGATVAPGTYTSDVSGTAANTYSIIGTTATAPVTVTALTLQPLALDASAAPTSTTPGSTVNYTVTLSNPNALATDAQTITVTLPTGFSFVPGSGSGGPTQPSASGNSLTWTGPMTAGANGQLALGFSATVGSTVAPGTYSLDLAGTAAPGVTGKAGAAPVTVTAAPIGPGPGPGPGPSGTVTPVPVDEPLALLVAAGALCAFAVRRRRQRVHPAH